MAEEEEMLTIVTRKAAYGLPTACPTCLPIYIYLSFSKLPFQNHFNLIHPDSDQIPYVEYGPYVAYNNERGGAIESLKDDGVVDLDSDVESVPEWISTKAMVSTWLADAVMYELWLGSDGSPAHKIYYSDLPWPLGKILFLKQVYVVKQLLGITKDNAERRETEIYRKAAIAYGALSTRLGDQKFMFEDKPTSLDALFLGHALFTLQALPGTSTLRTKLLEHSNLVNYADKLNSEYVQGSSSSSSTPLDHASPSPGRVPSSSRAKRKNEPNKKEKTEEEKTFRRRAKYFLATQAIAVVLFLSLMGGFSDDEVELEDGDDEGFDYNE